MPRPNDHIIFALDVSSKQEALSWVSRIGEHVGWFKIGLELFVSLGPRIVEDISSRTRVFLDLKLHDIPATVSGAAKAAEKLGARVLSVHVDTGAASLKRAIECTSFCKIAAISVLTSIAQSDLAAEGDDRVLVDLVRRRVTIAHNAGCESFVCSGQEAHIVRSIVGAEAMVICPGIRIDAGPDGDQKRVVTPKMAIDAGASHLVIGRPIRNAPDPLKAIDDIVAQISP